MVHNTLLVGTIVGWSRGSQFWGFLWSPRFGRPGRMHVILTEELSASMVMLRRVLKWSLRDVLYWSIHDNKTAAADRPAARKKKLRTNATFDGMPDATALAPGRLSWDEQLNAALRPVFADERQSFRLEDPDFEREVAALRRINSVLPRVCAEKDAHPPGSFLAKHCRADKTLDVLTSKHRRTPSCRGKLGGYSFG